ncbi:MAG: TonB-dependent receptor, partial [Janthinobacterium lividum]
TVTITHTPSGTRSVLTTDNSGLFNATGLRIGGPYAVVVTAAGFDAATTGLDSLQAGQPARVAVVLAAAGQTITVTGSRAQRSAITIASGPSTTLDKDQILGVATINRDIRDLARRDPLVTLDPTNSRAISIAGQNNRFNRITVDGVLFGDPFGLNNGGLASNRGPVPIDAICQFTVEVAPADIQQGNFQGGAINTQLCSGTNQFHGSGFYTYSGDSLAGDRTRDLTVKRTFDSKNFGGQVTGPLVEDKLFFAVTYEQLNASTPALVGPAGEAFANTIGNISRGQVTNIQNILRGTRYNYDPLDVAASVPEFDQKLVVKLDYNIAEGHRAFATYIYSEGSSLAGNTAASTLSATNPTLSLQSNNYSATERNHYGVFQTNDDWSDVFSTQVRLSFNDYKRGQDPYAGTSFGQFTVCLDPTSAGSPTTCTPGQGQIAVGPDTSRQANTLRVKTYTVETQAQIKLDDHSVKIIAERREQDINNLFQQNASGAFYFDSVADLVAGRAGSLTLAVPVDGDLASGAAIFHNINYTFGVQDVWDASRDLTLIYGFRYDLYDSNVRPPANQNFINRYGFTNNFDLAGKGSFQPRLAFTYGPGDRLRVRGSAGLYAGGAPNVWVANSYANPGTAFNSINVQRTATGFTNVANFGGLTANQLGSAGLDGVTGGTGIPSVFDQFIQRGLSSLALTNAIAPNFKIPAQYRYALSGDYKLDLGRLGDGWGIGGDAIYSDVQQALTWTDLRSVANGTLPDGRPRYQQLANTAGNGGSSLVDSNQDVLLTNTKKGHSLNLVARASKDFDSGLSLSASYTYQRVRDVNSGTSSVALSNYNSTVASDPNNSAYGISNYQIDNTIKAGIGYQHKFIGDATTRFDLFLESRAGQRYSYTFADLTSGRSAVFGTTSTNNRYLLYVPTGTTDPLVSYAAGSVGGVAQTAAQAQAALNSLISGGTLSDYRGQIAPKNIGKSPRFNKLDLHVSQEVPFFRQTRFEVFADIENVLNLLNHNWGSLRQVAFPYYGTVANVACLATIGATTTISSPSQPCAQYQYSSVKSPALTYDNISLWQVRIGGRFRF